jgi:hypothetical protein
LTGTAALSLWWIVAWLGIRVPRWLLGWPGRLALLVVCAVLAELGVRAVRRVRPGFLASPEDLRPSEALRRIALWCVPAYLAVAAALWALALVLVPSDDERRALVVYGLPLWGGLWLCPPVATLVAWRRARRRIQRPPEA